MQFRTSIVSFIFLLLLIPDFLPGLSVARSIEAQPIQGQYFLTPIAVETGMRIAAADRARLRSQILKDLRKKIDISNLPSQHNNCNNTKCFIKIMEQYKVKGILMPRVYRDADSFVLALESFPSVYNEKIPMREVVRIIILDASMKSLQIAAVDATRLIFTPDPEALARKQQVIEASRVRKRKVNNSEEGTGNVQILSGEMTKGKKSRLIVKATPGDADVSLSYKGNPGALDTPVEVTVRKDGYETQRMTVLPHKEGQFTLHVKLQKSANANRRGEREPQTTRATSALEPVDCFPCWGGFFRSLFVPGWGQVHKNSDLKGGLFGGFFVASLANYAYWDSQVDLALTQYGATLSRSYLMLALMNSASGSVNTTSNIYIWWQYAYRLEEDVSDLHDGALSCQLNTCKRYQRSYRNREYALGLVGVLYLWNVFDALIADGYIDPAQAMQERAKNYEEVQYNAWAVPDVNGGIQYRGGLQLRF